MVSLVSKCMLAFFWLAFLPILFVNSWVSTDVEEPADAPVLKDAKCELINKRP